MKNEGERNLRKKLVGVGETLVIDSSNEKNLARLKWLRLG
jgi:hypothetical protein